MRLAIAILFLQLQFGSGVFASPPSGQLHRSISFVNAGSRPIFSLRIGHAALKHWGHDLLGPTGVIAIGESRRISLRLVATCWYDVRAQYRNGHFVQLRDVDLCRARRLFLPEAH